MTYQGIVLHRVRGRGLDTSIVVQGEGHDLLIHTEYLAATLWGAPIISRRNRTYNETSRTKDTVSMCQGISR